ncbi:hypothetical protein [Nitratidesulfovibrio liaohensis]|uniref:Uncharacterized protein n=1 Tax=Nitratidesulfovibrio liaohensis TaxID=2604158 RepID=A0ABY9R2X6_9BACT|nr:hypothetical protein [Nitratidesulfovibrio liaohensis]WMW65957.1 hypothetical protein KPS_000492 [Nitratidesulfovibrio liaohensis]
MAIDGIFNNLGSMMVVHRTTGQDADAGRSASGSEQAQTADGNLARLTDSASLSALHPKLRSTLEDISERGGNVLETLEQNVADLQEGFLDTLSDRLDAAGVSLDEKLTLTQGDEGALSVLGNHPDKARIEQALADAPELSSAFGELASAVGTYPRHPQPAPGGYHARWRCRLRRGGRGNGRHRRDGIFRLSGQPERGHVALLLRQKHLAALPCELPGCASMGMRPGRPAPP